MAIGNPIRADGHFADLSDQGHRDALEHRNPGGRPPEKCDRASAFLTEKLTQRDCKACDLINEWVAKGGAKGTVFNAKRALEADGRLVVEDSKKPQIWSGRCHPPSGEADGAIRPLVPRKCGWPLMSPQAFARVASTMGTRGIPR